MASKDSKLVLIVAFDVIAFSLAVAAELRRSTGWRWRYSRKNDETKVTTYFRANSYPIGMIHTVIMATVKPDSEFNYNYCAYNSDISTWYGVGAMLFLMASQLLNMVSSQFFCCRKALRPGCSRACAFLLFITCWMFFITTEVWLLAASVRNAHQTKYRTNFGVDSTPFCQTMRKGVFAAGAAFIFLNCIVSELYYLCFSTAVECSQPYMGDVGLTLMN